MDIALQMRHTSIAKVNQQNLTHGGQPCCLAKHKTSELFHLQKSPQHLHSLRSHPNQRIELLCSEITRNRSHIFSEIREIACWSIALLLLKFHQKKKKKTLRAVKLMFSYMCHLFIVIILGQVNMLLSIHKISVIFQFLRGQCLERKR